MSKMKSRLAAIALAGAAVTGASVGLAGTASAATVRPACDITWTFGCGGVASASSATLGRVVTPAGDITWTSTCVTQSPSNRARPEDMTWT